MEKSVNAGAESSQIHKAQLLSSTRITPDSSREEVRQLVFRTNDTDIDGRPGSCVHILAPGQYGNRYHTRLYTLASHDSSTAGTVFELCVRRCFFIDAVSGEEYGGVASNYLCDLKPQSIVEFSGPVVYPFEIPQNPNTNLLMICMGTGIAPFKSLIRTIYEKHGSWQGKVRLFHGANSGLEMLYMNDANSDLSSYVDQPTFKAFQAVSPRPIFNEPVAMDKALEQNAAEVWEIVNSPDSRIYLAGVTTMLASIDKTMSRVAGSPEAWMEKRRELVVANRWVEVLY
jgi:sulfite reductase alpha subunit-like flavoprotein